MRRLTILLVTVFAAWFCHAVELRDLRVLYVGKARSPRAADFRSFLSTNVAQVNVSDRVGFDPTAANNFDVVLLEWPQSESREEFPPKNSPLGSLSAWRKPTILLGSAGLHMAIVWEVKGGFG